MEPQETEIDEGQQSMQVLQTLTPEAVAYLEKKDEDGFSFNLLLPRKEYFDIVGNHIYYEIDVEGLKDYVGIDESAPLGAKTSCVLCISDFICNQAVELYPKDEHLQYLIYMWAELEDMAVSAEKRSFPRVQPSDVAHLKKEFYGEVQSWPVKEILRLHEVFSGLRASIGEHPEFQFIPRYIARIHMRQEDEELLGQVMKKNERDVRHGSFVTTVISSDSCFSRVAFTLGLESGCHVLPACDHSEDPERHLYKLRNFRMTVEYRQNRRHFERFGKLYANTYEEAMNNKALKDADSNPLQKPTLEDLWLGKVFSHKPMSDVPPIWVVGEELEKELGQPDPTYRHTVRAVALRNGKTSGEWEILTVTERGDNPQGRSGKPPLVGLPGGMRERGDTLRQTLCRETENESQTKSLNKVIALVALHKKPKRHDSDQENVDHWYYVQLDNEAGLSKKMIEGNEIYEVRWLPLSALATCGFQHTKQGHRTIWNVRKVHERKLLSINHASWIAKIIPTIPDIKIPENWEEFRNNINKFKTETYV